MTTNVFEQYLEAKGSFGGVARRAALVMLTAENGAEIFFDRPLREARLG